jgi:hypothetical protein
LRQIAAIGLNGASIKGACTFPENRQKSSCVRMLPDWPGAHNAGSLSGHDWDAWPTHSTSTPIPGRCAESRLQSGRARRRTLLGHRKASRAPTAAASSTSWAFQPRPAQYPPRTSGVLLWLPIARRGLVRRHDRRRQAGDDNYGRHWRVRAVSDPLALR